MTIEKKESDEIEARKKKYDVDGSLSVIIKPTNNCNMNCSYCYAGSGPDYKEIMNQETLENSIRKLAIFNGNGRGDESTFIWHGGEPLLVGLGFYKRVVDIQEELKQKGYKFKNYIQTNGTLVNDDVVDFFRQYGFCPGLSLDGPKEVNDKTKVYRTKKNGSYETFEDIIRSINLLKDGGIKTGIITVITKNNINSLPEIYKFLKQRKIGSKINPLLKAGRAKSSFSELEVTEEEYSRASFDLFKIWEEDVDAIHLDFFENLLKVYFSDGKHIPECQFMDSCQKKFLSIDFDGSVYPCGESCGIQEFRYGNINNNSLEDILSSPGRIRLLERSKKIEDCQECRYKELCNGGCPQRAYYSMGSITKKDPLCLMFKMFFNYFAENFSTPKNLIKLKGGK